MTKIFEDEFMEWQADMVSIALEFCDSKADKIYLYGSIEGGSYFFNLFFEARNQIVTMDKLNSVLDEKVDDCDDNQWTVLRIGIDDLKEIEQVCKKYEKSVPTQFKLTYDVPINNLKSKYKYDLMYSDKYEFSTDTIFMSWYEEVKQEIESQTRSEND